MARSSSLRFASVFALALASAAPGVAWAGDTSTAEALFTEGVNAMKRNDFTAACDAFAGSNDSDPSPGAQINLGLCNEKQGRTATAWGWYRSGAGLADQRGNRERAELARKEAERLEPKLRKLAISVKTPAPGLVVLRDGATVPAGVLGREIPVDPGAHSIEVSADGKKPYKTSVTVAAGPGVDRVEIPALEDVPVATPVAGPPGGREVGSSGAASSDGWGTQKTVGVVLGAAGFAAVITGVVFQVVGASQAEERDRLGRELAEFRKTEESALANRVNIENYEKAKAEKDDAAQLDENVALACFIGGGVLIAGGAVLFLTAKSGSEKSAALPLVTPWATKGGGGLGLSLAF